MTIKAPFQPQYGSNQVVTAGAASATITIHRLPKQVRITNTGANKAYIRTCDSTLPEGIIPATVADFAVPAGMSSTITKGLHHDRLTYISAAGTTLEVIVGEGF